MTRTWRDAAETVRRLGDQIDGFGTRVAAIALTGQGDGTWLVDGGGEPVAPAWLWLDARTAPLIDALNETDALRRIYAHTGCGINTCQQNIQLAWMSRHYPELLKRAVTAFHCKDWIYFKMTGRRVTDVSEGVFTFGDFRTHRYVPEILEMLGIGSLARLLPEMIDGTRTHDGLCAAAARQTGLPTGTPVVLGSLDVVCTAIGGGLITREDAIGCSIIGSTGMHMRLCPTADDVRLAPEPGGYVMPIPISGHHAQIQSNMAATLNIDWMVELACQGAGLLGYPASKADALSRIDAAVRDASPAAALYHPYIDVAGERGPFRDSNARAQFTGLSGRAGFADLARAVYEGLAFAARDCYEATGFRPREIRLTGGAARSTSFRTILADILNAEVRASDRAEVGAAGAALMAAVSIGAYPDLYTACRAWVDPRLGPPTKPSPEAAAFYDRLFPIYVNVRAGMVEIWRQLAQVKQGEKS